jgi:hypothetical protein
MTWRTSQGERILAGPEAILFREAVLSLADITTLQLWCNFGAIQNNLNRVTIFGSLCHVRQSGVYSH